MQKPAINASYDFIFANLHGMWAHAAKGENLARLLHAESEEQLTRLLSEYGLDASRRDLFHKSLANRELKVLTRIGRELDAASGRYYEAYVQRTAFEKIKALIHDCFFTDSPQTTVYYQLDVPGLQTVTEEQLHQSSSAEDFVDMLRPEFNAAEIRDIVKDVEANHDPIAMECEIDKLAYRNILERASAMPSALKATAEKLSKMENDIIDIMIALRNIRTYHLDSGRLRHLWLPGGTLSDRELDGLAKSETIAEAVRSLPYVYRKVLAPLADTKLYVCEHALWCFLYKTAHERFQDFDKMEQSIAAFPQLWHAEAQNISRVYEGFHFGIRPSELQDMMIG